MDIFYPLFVRSITKKASFHMAKEVYLSILVPGTVLTASRKPLPL